MSIARTFRTDSTSLENTESLAAQTGSKLRGGEVIALNSDLGGGKTAFVRGLARGMGSDDHVSSPTFTIGQEYRTPQLTLYHFDFYRLSEPGIMALELEESLADTNGVVAIEWGESVAGVLPERRLSIDITKLSETSRQFIISCPQELEYLLPDGVEPC